MSAWTFTWTSTAAERWDLDKARALGEALQDAGVEVSETNGGVDLISGQADNSITIEDIDSQRSVQLNRLIAVTVGHTVTARPAEEEPSKAQTCGCSRSPSARCDAANRLWEAANHIYYSQGYDAWMKALEPYNEHKAGVS